MVVVVGKTRQSRKATLISFLLALFPLPFFLPSPVLFEQLQFAIHFLGCFSVKKESWAWLTDNSLYLVNNSTSSFYIFLAFLKMRGWEYALLRAQFPPQLLWQGVLLVSMRNDVLLHLVLTGSFQRSWGQSASEITNLIHFLSIGLKNFIHKLSQVCPKLLKVSCESLLYVTFSFPHLLPSPRHKKNPNPPNLYFSSHLKASWESERIITILLEGMKMALEFLLGFYAFLFVVIATGKIIRNYQVMKLFQHKTTPETYHLWHFLKELHRLSYNFHFI